MYKRTSESRQEEESFEQAYVHRTHAMVEYLTLILKRMCVSVKVNGATEGYIMEDHTSVQGSRWSQYSTAIVTVNTLGGILTLWATRVLLSKLFSNTINCTPVI